MLLPDVNVLVYAHRAETDRHEEAARWVTAWAMGTEPFALAELALSGFLRVVTNKRIFRPASTMAQAMRFIRQLTGRPNCRTLRPGPRHWALLSSSVRARRSPGNWWRTRVTLPAEAE